MKPEAHKMGDTTRYDDRIDVDTDLSLTQTFAMISRSLGLLTKVRKLFAYKFVFATVALLPAIVLPWLLKIVVDQVILQQPIDETVRFPPFLNPLLNLIDGMTPSDNYDLADNLISGASGLLRYARYAQHSDGA